MDRLFQIVSYCREQLLLQDSLFLHKKPYKRRNNICRCQIFGQAVFKGYNCFSGLLSIRYIWASFKKGGWMRRDLILYISRVLQVERSD